MPREPAVRCTVLLEVFGAQYIQELTRLILA